MSDSFSDADNPRPSRFVANLASHPLLVVAVTFAIGAAATAVLLILVGGMDATAVVTTLATLWSLDLALAIYLLTARDTDKLLSHIDALQDQLSAALENPGPDAVVVEGPAEAAAQSESAAQPEPIVLPQPVVSSGTIAPPEPPARPGPITQPEPVAQPEPAVPVPTTPAGSPVSVTAYMPAEYLEALRQRARVGIDDIQRAWTPNPFGNGPWVVETISGDRWSVFQTRGGRPTVIPLGGDREVIRRQRREERLQQRDERLQQAQAERSAVAAQAVNLVQDAIAARDARHRPSRDRRQPPSD